jgi:prepilin-type N-terminal cleavage/methylation domain-containing protein
MRSKRYHRQSGFTLLELMIVVGIIAILAAVLVPTYQKHREMARIGAATQVADQCVRPAFSLYAAQNEGGFPSEAALATYAGLVDFARAYDCDLAGEGDETKDPGKPPEEPIYDDSVFWCWFRDSQGRLTRVPCNFDPPAPEPGEPRPQDYFLLVGVRDVSQDLRGSYLALSGSGGVAAMTKAEAVIFAGHYNISLD